MHTTPDDASSTTTADDATPTPDAVPDGAAGTEPATTLPPAMPSFRLGFAPGVNPAKWVSMWRDRRTETLQLVPVDVLDDGARVRSGDVEAALVRLPVDRAGLDVIALYDEVPVVVVPLDHVITAVDEVSVDDLADEVLLHARDDLLEWEERPGTPARDRPATTADAVALVAAGIGVLVVPMSVARLHHRRDLTYRPLVDGPPSGIALVWKQYEVTELIEAFIGIVRGRTANSSRGGSATPAADSAEQDAAKKSAQPVRGKSGKPAGRGLPPRNPGRKPKPGKLGRKGKGKGSR